MPTPRVLRLPPDVFRRVILAAKEARVTASDVLAVAVSQFQELPLAVQRDLLTQFVLRDYSQDDAGPRPHSKAVHAKGEWFWEGERWCWRPAPAKGMRWWDGLRVVVCGALRRVCGRVAPAEPQSPRPGLASDGSRSFGNDASQAA